MTYKIIGGDQKEYGPITLEQLRQWVAEGRVNAQTRVQPEGATDWQPLSSFPELMPLGAAAPTAMPSAVVPGMKSAAELVNGPAIGLIVTAILGLLSALVGIVMNLAGMGGGMMGPMRDLPPAFQNMNALFGGLGVVQGIIGAAVAVVILLAALKMKKLESYKFVMTGTILAMAPCVSPCCLLGLPFGIWALVVLNKPEVKSAFH